TESLAAGELCRWQFAAPPLTGISFSPDGRRAVLGNASTVVLLDLEGGHAARTLARHDGEVTSTAFLPDGRQCVSAGRDKKVHFWDLETGKRLPKFPWSLPAQRLAVTPDGQFLVAGVGEPAGAGNNAQALIWELD